MTVDEAEAAVRAARHALATVTDAIDAEVAAAKAAIVAAHATARRAADDALFAANAALREANDRTPDHPWTGRRVFKLARAPGQAAWERHPAMIRVEGMVETVRSSTEFPLNTSRYSRPNVGSAIVRPLTKSGQPGIRFETLHSSYHGWKLAE